MSQGKLSEFLDRTRKKESIVSSEFATPKEDVNENVLSEEQLKLLEGLLQSKIS